MTSNHPNGADALVATALHNGVEVCFANPGTTELHLVEALDREPRLRTVLCSFEGVCSGAADAYYRMSGRPALGLYHLGPGFANSLANQHNARRHGSGMVNVIGDQASWHLAHDAPLTSDIDALSGWVGQTITSADSEGVSSATAAAIAVARAGGIAQLVVPVDHAWGPATDHTSEAAAYAAAALDPQDVERAASLLRREGAVLIAGGAHLSAESMAMLGRIRHATGCSLYITRAARIETGNELPDIADLPYFPSALHGALAGASTAVMIGRSEPVTFFGYPDTPSLGLPDPTERMRLGRDSAHNGADVELALSELAAALGADVDEPLSPQPLPDIDTSAALDTRQLGIAVARSLQPDHIVALEGLTSGATYRALAPHAAPHTIVGVLGGAIGGGLPAAVGAAVACPNRPVLAFQADGSALYTIQSLWTMAREQLDVTVVICANRRYAILDVEVANAGMELGEIGRSLTDLSPLDFVSLAAGFGVPGRRADSPAELVDALAWAAGEPGPHLIEVVLAG